MLITPRDYQVEAVNSTFSYFEKHKTGNPLIAMPTACHAKDHLILMANGTFKKVQDVRVDDLLMGVNSQPRLVLSLARGRQVMRKIIPKNGDPFIVNLDHKLFLHVTKQGGPSKLRQSRNEVVTVREYENGSNWFRHLRKLQRAKVEFKKTEQTIPPYILGLLLGDGCLMNGGVSLTTKDDEIHDAFSNYIKELGLVCRINNKYANKARDLKAVDPLATRSTPNRLTKKLRSLKMMDCYAYEKAIPSIYKICSHQQQLEILAGLIDTDGHYCTVDKGNYFEYCTTSPLLANDVLFLIRCLGFRGGIKKFKTTHRDAFRINISGNINKIPTRLLRKQAAPSAKQKNCKVTGFRVEKLPVGNYYGFELDGDKLYLDSDFIIHHNTGKSVVIASFLEQIFDRYRAYKQKIMILTHVKELIAQNYEKLMAVWPNAPAGIYSAGLGKRDIYNSIIFGGIGSVAKRADEFQHVDLIIIDEAHLLSPNQTTMYQLFIKNLLAYNPHLRIIGLTATPFRLGQGHLTEGENSLFTSVCFDITGMVAFNRLIAECYLCPLIPKRTKTTLDTNGVHKRGGEFIQKELQQAVDRDELTEAAIKEAIEIGAERRKWLIFTTGVEHTEHTAAIARSHGINVLPLHSKLKSGERDERIAMLKAGELDGLVNNNILTTGFDDPEIDFILGLRPTNSAALWIQMLGRGTRNLYVGNHDMNTVQGRYAAICEGGKMNCLVLDYGGNTKRLGPINDPLLPGRPGQKGGTAPVKICEACDTYNHASVRNCSCCGAEFEFQTKLMQNASTDQIIKGDLPKVENFVVTHVTYARHEKKDSPASLKVSYYCNLKAFTEYVCIEHTGRIRFKVNGWWEKRSEFPVPETVEMALHIADRLRTPTHLSVWTNKKHPEIMNYCFDGTGFGDADLANKPPPKVTVVAKPAKKLKIDTVEKDIPFNTGKDFVPYTGDEIPF